MKVKKIIGPPGTGKTTRLIAAVKVAEKKGIDPSSIGYFSFTKKAAEEARSRQNDKRYKYFTTLHALCYRLLKLNNRSIIWPKHYAEICASLGLDHHHYVEREHAPPRGCNGDRMEFCYSLMRNCMMEKPLFKDELFTEADFNRFCATVEKYKDKWGLWDWADLLASPKVAEQLPHFKLLLIDEAQDLTKLQWELVRKLTERSEYTLLAGDDDQAIYNWAGADGKGFVDFPYLVQEVLDKSYRLPRVIHEESQQLRRNLSETIPKAFAPTDKEGTLLRVSHVEDIDMTEGDWMVLTRTHYGMAKLEHQLQGLNNPNIRVSTIHAAKGGEWDNVVIIPDMSYSAYQEYLTNRDTEIRVFYVAITRAKSKLVIVSPFTRRYFDLIV